MSSAPSAKNLWQQCIYKPLIHVSFSTIATYVTACHLVKEERSLGGISWLDKNTLIAAYNKLVKYTIDPISKTCIGEVVDSDNGGKRISCSPDGKIYVADIQSGEVTVRIYDANTWEKEVWYTKIQRRTHLVHVSVNADFIVISVDNASYIYNKERVLQYKVTHDLVQRDFLSTYLTDTGVFWGTTNSGLKLLTVNLLSKETKTITDGIVNPWFVTGARNGYVYVSRIYIGTVGVHSPDGTFLHTIQMDITQWRLSLSWNAAVKISGNRTLIGFGTTNITMPVAIFMFT